MAMQPPPNESLQERQEREKNEAAATLRSESIDEYLRGSGKKSKPTKLLLLGSSTLFSIFSHHLLISRLLIGQSESGTS